MEIIEITSEERNILLECGYNVFPCHAEKGDDIIYKDGRSGKFYTVITDEDFRYRKEFDSIEQFSSTRKKGAKGAIYRQDV